MAIKLGNTSINKAYLGGVEINKLYLGSNVIFDNSVNTNAFIIEVDTTKAGSASDQFQFTSAEGDYDVVAKQGGTIVQTFNNLSDEETITFSNGSGVYVLEVTPKEVNGFNRIRFNNGGDKLKITDIKQWGTIVWSSFFTAFFRCRNMEVTATDIPNLSNLNNMYRAFRDCNSANIDARNWDISNIINLTGIFLNTNLSVNNLTACYENWSQLSLQQNVLFSAGTTKYNASGQAGRDILVNTYNWSITDGGPA
jgi:hypothetical protein